MRDTNFSFLSVSLPKVQFNYDVVDITQNGPEITTVL